MKLLYVLLIMSLTSPSWASVMSFSQWKAQQIGLAKSIYSDAVIDSRRGGQEGLSRLRKARVKLVVAQELSPNDYFELYLSRHYNNNFKALEMAAKKMRPAELAEILMSYSDKLNHVEVSPVSPLSRSFSSSNSPGNSPGNSTGNSTNNSQSNSR